VAKSRARAARQSSIERSSCETSSRRVVLRPVAGKRPDSQGERENKPDHLFGRQPTRRRPPAISRGRRPVPRMDRKPSPARGRARADARPLARGRRVHPRRQGAALPGSRAASPAPPLSHLNSAQPRVIAISTGLTRPRTAAQSPKLHDYQELSTRSKVATPKSFLSALVVAPLGS
jgi:hypothetical protein